MQNNQEQKRDLSKPDRLLLHYMNGSRVRYQSHSTARNAKLLSKCNDFQGTATCLSSKVHRAETKKPRLELTLANEIATFYSLFIDDVRVRF